MRLFVDTNVVVDYLARREEFYRPASVIFDMSRCHLITCVVSALTIVNCAYVMRKYFGKEKTLSMLKDFMQTVEISPIDQDVLTKAMDDLPYDFEDAVQYFSSVTNCVDLIITRDEKGFRKYRVPVMSPIEFLQACSQ